MWAPTKQVDSQPKFVLVRPRRYATKRRTGCISCKRRRVRCDEAQPECNRCLKLGVQCERYAVPVECKPIQSYQATAISKTCYLLDDSLSSRKPSTSTSFQSELQPINSEYGNFSSAAQSKSVQVYGMTTPSVYIEDRPNLMLQRRFSAYFRDKTAPWLSGYLEDPVWQNAVPQMSRDIAAIHYASCALAALHEEQVSLNHGDCSLSPIESSFTTAAAQLYVRALSELKQLLSATRPHMGAMIVSAMLCVHFESLRENYVPALVHGDSAIKSMHDTMSSTTNILDRDVIRVIKAMDTQASISYETRIPTMSSNSGRISAVLPVAPESLTHGRDLIDARISRLLYFTRTSAARYRYHPHLAVPFAVLTEAQNLRQMSDEMARLLSQSGYPTEPTSAAHADLARSTLRIRVLLYTIQSATCLCHEATPYDAWLNSFDEIVALCAYVLRNDNMGNRPWSATVDDALLFPLFFSATRCRDGRIRHRALSLMQGLPGAYRMWHPRSWIRVAERWIWYEEQAVCTPSDAIIASEIPERARVHTSHFNGLETLAPQVLPKVHSRTWPNGLTAGYVDVECPLD